MLLIFLWLFNVYFKVGRYKDSDPRWIYKMVIQHGAQDGDPRWSCKMVIQDGATRW